MKRSRPARVLAFNVAGLMGGAAGDDRRPAVQDAWIDMPADLRLAAPIEGSVRLARTGRSILAGADLTTALEEVCSRCLRSLVSPVHVEFLEEALPSIDFATGEPLDLSAEPDALRIDEHHVLDLAGPVRDAISMAEPIAPLCRPDCRGLCPECGADLNDDPEHNHDDTAGDPRLAPLAAWLERSGRRRAT
jgi:DUF177 domain-containing protein